MRRTYMIIEQYKTGKAQEIYKRFSENGRMLPEGVEFVDSWVQENLQVCYQVMTSPSREKLDEWIEKWSDLVNFKVIPVLNSEEAKQKTLGGNP